MKETKNRRAPHINVTPLIDVLLVLLVIFMVVTPSRPSRFKTHVPQPPPPQTEDSTPDPLMLVVTVNKDLGLKLNKDSEMGSISDPSKLQAALTRILQERRARHTYRTDSLNLTELPEEERLQKTVFIKAPRALRYGEVVKVIDIVKEVGADPVGLQIDELD